MKRCLRILVTAANGDLAQAIIKALRVSQDPYEIHGCDLEIGIGRAFVESFHTMLRADNTAYLDALDALCRELRIDAVVPACEPEIDVLSRFAAATRLPCGAAIVCQDANMIEVFGDKLRCMQTFTGKVPLAPFADGRDPEAVGALIERAGFPLVVKSRKSSGSKTLRVAHTRDELRVYLDEITLPLVQGYIDRTGGEFSAGVFVCEAFSSSIIFVRDLGPIGASWFAEAVQDDEVQEYVHQVMQTVNSTGSFNIQVRKSADGVRLLEINPRFSSLAAARSVCGFYDVAWSVKCALGMPPEPPARPYKSIRFRRFFHEMVDFGKGFQAIAEWAPQSVVVKTE